MSEAPTPHYPRGTNKLQIASRELLTFTSQRMTSANNLSNERVASLALRVLQLMNDSLDTKTMDELRDSMNHATFYFKAYSNNTLVGVVDMGRQAVVLDSIQARSQTYENNKMQKHANFCRCLVLFLKALTPGNLGITDASRAVVKAFYAGADRDKLQHAVMLLF